MSELSRRERKKRETQEKIYNSAMQLFRTKGFNETSIEEITIKADVGKGTFYNYYSSKEAVILEFSKKQFQDVLGRGEIDSRLTIYERIEALLNEWTVFMVNERELVSIALRSTWEKDLDSDLYRRLKAIIAAGQRNGEIRSEHKAEFLAQSLEGMVIQHFMRWYVSKGGINLNVNNIVNVFFEGLKLKNIK